MDEEVRGVRQRKKNTDPTCCPVCGITVRANEMGQHYALEMERLNKLSKKSKVTNSLSPRPRDSREATGVSGSLPAGCSTSPSDANDIDQVDVKDCWATYQRIKNNRSSRLKVQVRNKKRKIDEPACPVCSMPVPGDINLHVESCLKRSERTSGAINGANSDEDDEGSIDVEGEAYEEYEWAGQTRIRASSLLEGGYSGAGFAIAITNATATADDEDLNVDGDDSQIYGSPQYTERDIIVPLAEDNTKENLYLRNLVLAQTACAATEASITPGRSSRPNEIGDHTTQIDMDVQPSTSNSEPNCSASTSRDGLSGTIATSSSLESAGKPDGTSSGEAFMHIIDALKAKIREYEVIIRNKSKCLICMDDFRVPVVSICCWHVHCEECWLRTLGARKLCPQCNMITSATDLRRIYM